MSKITIIWEISLLMFVFMGCSAIFGVIFDYFNSNMGYLFGLFFTFPYLYFMPKTEKPFELSPGE